MNKRRFLVLATSAAVLPSWPLTLLAQPAPAASFASVSKHYAVLVSAAYDDTLAAAQALQAAVAAFTRQPTAESLAAARKAWLDAREWYGQTEAFRFYGGPIDDDKGPEGRINAWPMDESFVDGTRDRADAGLINDKKAPITKAHLSKMNERGGEENIATGWHAIEFLLWGQDFNDNGPGDRSFEDFVDGRKPNADRRRRYLTVVTELLIDDLRFLSTAWKPGVRGNYRARFEAGGKESVRKMIVGLGSLSRGELAGERLEVSLNTQDQEDEHSCFSDNTHRDAVTNALGIENVWLGQFRRLDGSMVQGPSLRDLVQASNPAVAERTTRQVSQSVAAAREIRAPFDQEILGDDNAPGRRRIKTVIDSLVQQSKDLVDAASAIGITQLTLVNP